MKKKILGILVCMLMIAAAALPVAGFKNIYDNDVEDKAYHSTVANSLLRMTTRDTWDLRCSFDVEAASGAAGNAGAEFDGTYFYSTRWASNLLHQYDKNGVLIKELRLLSRALFVLDKEDNVTYVEYVPELSSHPNYDKALEALKKVIG